MLIRRLALLLPVLLCSAGCNTQSVLDRIAPETTQEAKTNFDYLRHHQYDQIKPLLDKSITTDSDLDEKLAHMASLVPAGDPVSVKKVGAFARCDTGEGCRTRVTLEYQFPSQWLLVQMVVHNQDEQSSITSFDVQQESASLKDLNRFTLRGKTPLQYVVLACAIASLGLMVYAFVACVRTRGIRRKWLWLIFILVGVGQVIVDWTTGEVDYHVIYFKLPPAWIDSQPYGSWTVFTCIPLGALAFLFYRERLSRPPAIPDGSLAFAPVYPRPVPQDFTTPASSVHPEAQSTTDDPA